MIRSLIVAGVVAATLAGCNVEQVPPPVPEPEPAGPRQIWTELPDTGGISVTVFNDPGGCQYLVFMRQGVHTAITATPRLHRASSGTCMSAKKE